MLDVRSRGESALRASVSTSRAARRLTRKEVTPKSDHLGMPIAENRLLDPQRVLPVGACRGQVVASVLDRRQIGEGNADLEVLRAAQRLPQPHRLAPRSLGLSERAQADQHGAEHGESARHPVDAGPSPRLRSSTARRASGSAAAYWPLACSSPARLWNRNAS
jgi:hypothetical protein